VNGFPVGTGEPGPVSSGLSVELEKAWSGRLERGKGVP